MGSNQVEESYEVRSAREKEERCAWIEKSNARLKRILKLLGFKYKKPDEPNWWDSVVSGVLGESQEIYLNAGRPDEKPQRIWISGNYPRGPKGEYVEAYKKVPCDESWRWEKVSQPRISVSPDKSDEQIVKDIRNRFLPDYLFRLELVLQKIEESKEYEEKNQGNLARLARLVNKGLDDWDKNNRRFVQYFKESDDNSSKRIEVQVSGDSVKMEFDSLNVAEAAAIIEAAQRILK